MITRPSGFQVSAAALRDWLRIAPEGDAAGLGDEIQRAEALEPEDVEAAFGTAHPGRQFYLLPNEQELAVTAGRVVVGVLRVSPERLAIIRDMTPEQRRALRRGHAVPHDAADMLAQFPEEKDWPTDLPGLRVLRERLADAQGALAGKGISTQPLQQAIRAINRHIHIASVHNHEARVRATLGDANPGQIVQDLLRVIRGLCSDEMLSPDDLAAVRRGGAYTAILRLEAAREDSAAVEQRKREPA